MVRSRIAIKEDSEKVRIYIKWRGNIFKPLIEKDKKTNIFRIKHYYYFFIPVEKTIAESLKEIIGVEIHNSGLFNIVLKFKTKSLIFGSVDFIDISSDFKMKQILSYEEVYHTAVTKEDLLKIAKLLKVKLSFENKISELKPLSKQ